MHVTQYEHSHWYSESLENAWKLGFPTRVNNAEIYRITAGAVDPPKGDALQ
jgi:hypothetical protein